MAIQKNLIDLIVQCEYDLKGTKTSKEFAPSCSINEIAAYLYKHGVVLPWSQKDRGGKR